MEEVVALAVVPAEAWLLSTLRHHCGQQHSVLLFQGYTHICGFLQYGHCTFTFSFFSFTFLPEPFSETAHIFKGQKDSLKIIRMEILGETLAPDTAKVLIQM